MNQTAELKAKGTRPTRYQKSDAIKYLESMADNAARVKYPNVPYLAPRKYRDDSSNKLTKCVIDFLRLSGHQAEQIQRRITTKKTFCYVIGHQRSIIETHWVDTGTNYDISAIIGEITVHIKIGRDPQSQAQVIEGAERMSVAVTSFERFLSWYNHTTGEVQP